jgi:hypothetical protein
MALTSLLFCYVKIWESFAEVVCLHYWNYFDFFTISNTHSRLNFFYGKKLSKLDISDISDGNF